MSELSLSALRLCPACPPWEEELEDPVPAWWGVDGSGCCGDSGFPWVTSEEPASPGPVTWQFWEGRGQSVSLNYVIGPHAWPRVCGMNVFFSS